VTNATPREPRPEGGPATLPPLKGLLIDLGGVVYRGDHCIAGAPEFFRFLRRVGLPFLLITNNSTLTPDQYVAKLAGMGIDVTADEVLGSAGATAQYLRRTAPPGARVYAIGEDGLRAALTEAGFVLVEEDVQYVVVGLDRGFDYRKLTLAVRHVTAGAAFVGTNPDSSLPMPDGIIPGAATLHAAITAATGVAPLIVGKPEPTMLLMGAERLGCAPSEVAMIGDRLDTDVVGGGRAGVVTILVLTGVSTRQDVEASPVKPDFLFYDPPTSQEALRESRSTR